MATVRTVEVTDSFLVLVLNKVGVSRSQAEGLLPWQAILILRDQPEFRHIKLDVRGLSDWQALVALAFRQAEVPLSTSVILRLTPMQALTTLALYYAGLQDVPKRELPHGVPTNAEIAQLVESPRDLVDLVIGMPPVSTESARLIRRSNLAFALERAARA